MWSATSPPRRRWSRVTCAPMSHARRCPRTWCPHGSSVLERFPTLANGKIDRGGPCRGPDAAAEDSGRRTGAVTSVEAVGCAAVVCAIVRDVLGIPEASLTDNFFQLGGHSVQATRRGARSGYTRSGSRSRCRSGPCWRRRRSANWLRPSRAGCPADGRQRKSTGRLL
ncbi:phosphopantetheine-binding protein [Streptomyces echinatus]|uniref:phosphopantetheine-binding protein n=1 Tax=Streptomyces echinatus TaxID=67293 RepID=UPI003CD068F3